MGSDGLVWITCTQPLRNKGTFVMFYDFFNSKFVTETKATFYCKNIALLPNGIPLLMTESGSLFLIVNRQKHLKS